MTKNRPSCANRHLHLEKRRPVISNDIPEHRISSWMILVITDRNCFFFTISAIDQCFVDTCDLCQMRKINYRIIGIGNSFLVGGANKNKIHLLSFIFSAAFIFLVGVFVNQVIKKPSPNIDYYKRVPRNKAIGWLQEIDEEFKKINGIWSNKDLKPAFYLSISFRQIGESVHFSFRQTVKQLVYGEWRRPSANPVT